MHQIYLATKCILGLGVLQLNLATNAPWILSMTRVHNVGDSIQPIYVLTNSVQVIFFFDKRKYILEILKLYNIITPLPHLDSETIQDKVVQQVEINI